MAEATRQMATFVRKPGVPAESPCREAGGFHWNLSCSAGFFVPTQGGRRGVLKNILLGKVQEGKGPEWCSRLPPPVRTLLRHIKGISNLAKILQQTHCKRLRILKRGVGRKVSRRRDDLAPARSMKEIGDNSKKVKGSAIVKMFAVLP